MDQKHKNFFSSTNLSVPVRLLVEGRSGPYLAELRKFCFVKENSPRKGMGFEALGSGTGHDKTERGF